MSVIQLLSMKSEYLYVDVINIFDITYVEQLNRLRRFFDIKLENLVYKLAFCTYLTHIHTLEKVMVDVFVLNIHECLLRLSNGQKPLYLVSDS